MQNNRQHNFGEYKLGLIYTFSAFLIWGMSVMFFKQVSHVPPFEMIAHRSIWSLVVLAIIITYLKKWASVFVALKKPKTMLLLTLSSIAILGNWSLFIWSITNNFVIEASLGYFINPLFNVLIGVIILSERLTKAQSIAIGLAAIAIAIRLVLAGTFPWIALTLATSFAFYGYIRKTLEVGAAEGLFIELLILLLPLLGYLYYWHFNFGLSFATIDLKTDFLIVISGLVTAIPLLLFSAGARRIRLSTVGLLQYIAPSMQFFIGLYYGENFSMIDALVFGLIWIGLIIYSVSSFRQDRQEAKARKLA